MVSCGKSRAVGVFQMVNLDCSGCAAMVSKSLGKVIGIESVGINYITDKVYVSYDPRKVTPERIRGVIERAGHKASQTGQRMEA